MNELVGVNREAENLLSRIPIRDFTFCDQFFVILGFFGKIRIFGKSDPGTTRVDIFENKIIKNTFILYILYKYFIFIPPASFSFSRLFV